MKEFWKSVKIWQSYGDVVGVQFLVGRVYPHVGVCVASDQSPAEADLNYLSNATKMEMYGIEWQDAMVTYLCLFTACWWLGLTLNLQTVLTAEFVTEDFQKSSSKIQMS